MWNWLERFRSKRFDCDCGKNNYVPVWSDRWPHRNTTYFAYCKSCYASMCFGYTYEEAQKNLQRIRKRL